MAVEAWLRGPLPGVPAVLMPAAHALVEVREVVARLVSGLTDAQIWATPGRSASIGFHVRHIAGSLDRLLTYARGETLDADQRSALVAEPSAPPEARDALLQHFDAAVARALDQVMAIDPGTIGDARHVGRAQLPTTVLGLVFHAAEHATRHAGQIATLVKVLEA